MTRLMSTSPYARAQGLLRLQSVFAPAVVGIPPTNAIRELMMIPDGEIRHYGFEGDFKRGDVVRICHSSPDYAIRKTLD